MKMKVAVLALLAVVMALPVFSQTIAAPQYTVNLNFLTGGIYGNITAVDTVFGTQLTTNAQLEGDVILAPNGGATAYEGGFNYNLCGAKAIENALAGTTLNCGKIQPLAAFVAGLGRVQQGGSPTEESVAYTAKLGLGYDPTGTGHFSLAFMGGWGKFGPAITGQSNNGFVFYSGITFGGGNSAAATQAKIARIRRSDAKKLKKLQAAAAASN
jgi:hypothetical protein